MLESIPIVAVGSQVVATVVRAATLYQGAFSQPAQLVLVYYREQLEDRGIVVESTTIACLTIEQVY